MIKLYDPRRAPENATKLFQISSDAKKVKKDITDYYRRHIVGIYDEDDRVYYPLGFIVLNKNYFASRQKLIVVSGINTNEYIESKSPIKVPIDKRLPLEGKDESRRVFAALDTNKSGLVLKSSMTSYLTVAFENLFRVLGESNEVCTPNDLAVSVTVDCFNFIGENIMISLEQFSSWYSAPGSMHHHELRNLMSQAIEIYLHPAVKGTVSPNEKRGYFLSKNLSLENAIAEIKQLSGLNQYRVTDIIRFFLSQCDASNCLDHESFSIMFQHLCGNSGTAGNINDFIDILFAVFDFDDKEFVNLVDFGNCLPLFCSGAPEEMANVSFRLADHDQDQRLSPRELFIFLRSITHFLYQISDDIADVYGNRSPDEIAWATTVSAFAMNGLTIDVSDFDQLNSSLSTLTGIHCKETLNFQQFRKWYFNGNGLHTSSWMYDAEASDDNMKTELDNKISVHDEELSINLLEAKNQLPLKSYSAGTLVNFFCSLAEEDGMLSQSNFYHAFDKLLKTHRSPRSQSFNALAIDITISKIYSTYDPSGTGFITVRDMLCGLLIFCGDDDRLRAEAIMIAIQWSNGHREEEERKIAYILEKDMAASLASVLKLLLAFNLRIIPNQTRAVSPEYLAASLTVDAYTYSKPLTVIGDEYCIDPEVFCDWLSAIYETMDDEIFSNITFETQARYLLEVKRRAIGDPEENGEEDTEDDENETIPTDQSVGWDGDSVTLNSGSVVSGNSIVSPIVEELDHTKYLLGLSNICAEDLMQTLGENSNAGFIELTTFVDCMSYFSQLSGLDIKYKSQSADLANEMFQIFDEQKSGVIKFEEIVVGLSILCDGSVTGDKIAVSFLSLDKLSRGVISDKDFRIYVYSCLKVLCICSSTAKAQLMRQANSSSSSTIIYGSGYYTEEFPNLISALEVVSNDVINLCYSCGLLKKAAHITLEMMCNILGEFRLISNQMVEDSSSSPLEL